MNINYLKAWGIDTGIRAVKTGAQTAVALLGADVAGLLDADWVAVGSASGLAVVVSILHNLASFTPNGRDVEVERFPMESSN